ALHGVVPDIARRKRSRHARLQKEGLALQRPARRRPALRKRIRTGDKIPARVSDDGGLACPVGVWGATDADKEPRRIDPRRRACPHRYEAQANRTRRHYARESRERGKPRSIP